MARTKGSHDISPMIRGAFIRAVKQLESKGKSLSEIIAKELEERPLDTLRAISAFNPKHLDATVNVTGLSDILAGLPTLAGTEQDLGMEEVSEAVCH